MSYVDSFVDEYEDLEDINDMHFSLYYIPEYYQPEDDLEYVASY